MRSAPTIATSSTATTYTTRRVPERRTNIMVSTQTTPISAVFSEVCPDGYDRLDTMSMGSCHSGRTRPVEALTKVVSRYVETITSAAYTAARR